MNSLRFFVSERGNVHLQNVNTIYQKPKNGVIPPPFISVTNVPTVMENPSIEALDLPMGQIGGFYLFDVEVMSMPDIKTREQKFHDETHVVSPFQVVKILSKEDQTIIVTEKEKYKINMNQFEFIQLQMKMIHKTELVHFNKDGNRKEIV